MKGIMSYLCLLMLLTFAAPLLGVDLPPGETFDREAWVAAHTNEPLNQLIESAKAITTNTAYQLEQQTSIANMICWRALKEQKTPAFVETTARELGIWNWEWRCQVMWISGKTELEGYNFYKEWLAAEPGNERVWDLVLVGSKAANATPGKRQNPDLQQIASGSNLTKEQAKKLLTLFDYRLATKEEKDLFIATVEKNTIPELGN